MADCISLLLVVALGTTLGCSVLFIATLRRRTGRAGNQGGLSWLRGELPQRDSDREERLWSSMLLIPIALYLVLWALALKQLSWTGLRAGFILSTIAFIASLSALRQGPCDDG